MKAHCLFLMFSWSLVAFAADPAAAPEAPPAAAPPLRSAAELEKLVASIALYPDPLIATMLPASVYPLEIVQAARFVKDTNNLATLDAQPWDANVKAVARVPEVIKKMNDELPWTMELGEAFLSQDKDLFDALQRLRGQAAQIGNLKTSPQQIVTVTNVVVEKTIEQQVVVVTNTVVQVQPADPQVVYVPQYSPTVVYTTPPPDPTATLLTFGVGMLMGAAIANNNCDWNGGGCYHGDVNINVNNNVNVNRNANINRSANATSAGQKWKPEPSRLSKSGSPNAASSARAGEARGWGSSGASPSTASTRASAGNAGARPSTGAPSASRPGAAPSASPGASRTGASPSASPSASRPSPSPSASQSKPSPSSSGSAFGGASSGSEARTASSRGSSSRSSGGGGRSSAGGGGRSGGGRR